MNLISIDVFEEFSPVDGSESFGDSWSDLYCDSCGFSECVPVVPLGVPVVTDVSVCPRSVCLVRLFPSDSDCEIVKLRFSSLSRKSQAFLWKVKKT